MNIEPPPPGVYAEDEVTGAAAVAAVQDGLMQLRTSADLRLTVRQMHVRRFNGVAMVFVGFTNGQSVTLRIKLGHVREVCDRLGAVLTESKGSQ